MSAIQQLLMDHLDIWTAADTGKKSGRGRSLSNAASVYGIRKLRELILELAVRGKLVPQDPLDEPACELLKRILDEKANLILEGKIKKGKLPPISDVEKPFELPLGWEWVHLPVICDYKVGKTPSTKSSVYWTNSDDGYNWVSIADLNHDGLVLETTKHITANAVAEVFKCDPAPSGTILMSFKLTLGKVSILDKPAFHNEAIISIYPNQSIFKDFLFKMLPARAMAGNSKSAIKGNTLNSESIAALLIPLAPLAEQHRIVAKVDELMALCDQMETQHNNATEAHEKLVNHLLGTLTQSQSAEEFTENWQRIATHFDTLFTTETSIEALKQTLLQLAVMGKLVPQDQNDEPANELLKRIQAEKAKLVLEGKIKKFKPLPLVTDQDKPFELPPSWKWSHIGDVAKSTDYGLSEKTFEITCGVPVLKMGDIQNGKVILGGQKRLDKEVNDLPELYLKNGDILYNRTNSEELVGKTGIYEGPDGEYTFASYLIRIRCVDGLFSPRFLNLAMNTPLFRKTQIVPHLKQQCGQANVNGTIMKNMIIPVPSFEEQNLICEKIDELIALCDQLKVRITKINQLQRKLADVVVAHVGI